MSFDSSRMDGPDFLEHVAEAELANGNLVNAQVYRERAHEWRDHQKQLDETRARLAAVEQRMERLREATKAALS